MCDKRASAYVIFVKDTVAEEVAASSALHIRMSGRCSKEVEFDGCRSIGPLLQNTNHEVACCGNNVLQASSYDPIAPNGVVMDDEGSGKTGVNGIFKLLSKPAKPRLASGTPSCPFKDSARHTQTAYY